MFRSILKGVVIGIVIFTSSILTAAPKTQKFIVKDGEALGKIYLPTNCGRAAIFATKELKDHIEKMTGAELQSAWRGATARDSGFVFTIRPEKEWKGKESSQAFTINQRIKPRVVVEIVGNSNLAVLYGVYQYLGDLGVRWLSPGDIGTNIPKMSNIAVFPSTKHYEPSFLSRAMALSSIARNHFGGVVDIKKAVYEYQLYLIRNRTQFGRNIAGRGFAFNICGTRSGHAIKPRTGLTRTAVKNGLLKKEPERFSMVTGSDYVKKRIYNGGQVCFTNEKNIKNAIENCVNYFKNLDKTKNSRGSDLDEDYTVDMGLSDGFGICECDNCKKMAGRGPFWKDKLVWTLWNRVAKGGNKEMPGRKIAVFAPYMDVNNPPKGMKLEPNLMAITCLVTSWEKGPENKETYPFSKSYYDCVSKIKAAGATLGCYDYQNFPWSPTPLHLLATAKGYSELGYKHYQLESMQRSPTEWPLLWVLAQYTWNTAKPPKQYLEEFCEDYYGKRYGKDIKWILEEMTRNALTMKRLNYGAPSDSSTMFPNKFIGKTRGILRNAVRNTQGKERERIRRFQVSMDAHLRMAQVYRSYIKALGDRGEEAIANFKKQAEALVHYWDKNHLERYTSTSRTPKVAAKLYLKTDFTNLKPITRKTLKGKGSKDKLWMRELFAGSSVPKSIPNLFPLPEIWKFRVDPLDQGVEKGYFKTDHVEKIEWRPISTWDFPSRQGYTFIGGDFWYRLKFKAPEFPAGKKVYLRIGSLDDTGDVYLNGVIVGKQPECRNWDKSFAIDVTKEIKSGKENIIAVHGYDSGGAEGIWRPSALYTD